MRDLNGRTIEAVEWNDYHDGEIQSIRFTDGTTLLIEDGEYGHTVKLLNDRALAQLARRREVRIERGVRRYEQQQGAAARKEARIARAKSMLPARVFEKWRRRVYPTTNEVLKDVWNPGVLKALEGPGPLSRLADPGESVTVPIRRAS